MKPIAHTATVAIAVAVLISPALAAGVQSDAKIETRIVASDHASGMVQLSNGMTLNQSSIIQSASLQHLYQTEGVHQLQRKLRSEIRYIANDTKA